MTDETADKLDRFAGSALLVLNLGFLGYIGLILFDQFGWSWLPGYSRWRKWSET